MTQFRIRVMGKNKLPGGDLLANLVQQDLGSDSAKYTFFQERHKTLLQEGLQKGQKAQTQSPGSEQKKHSVQHGETTQTILTRYQAEGEEEIDSDHEDYDDQGL